MKSQIRSLEKTAKNRKSPSLPLKLLLNKNLLYGDILDYGCGKGFDANYIKCDKYDPYYFPSYPTKLYDTIICIFVVNIIESDDDRNGVIQNIQNLLKNDGVAYICTHSDKRIKKNNYVINIDTECIYHHNSIRIFKIVKDQKCQAKKML